MTFLLTNYPLTFEFKTYFPKFIGNQFIMHHLGISIFVNYLMPKPSLYKNKLPSLTHSWRNKEVHAFPKGISQKVNVIARLVFEFAYFYDAVQPLRHGVFPLKYTVHTSKTNVHYTTNVQTMWDLD